MINNNHTGKYVNLHAHSVLSVGDGFGFPAEHMDFAHKNGLDAHAFTDHGTMAGFSYAYLHHKKMKSEGKDFKLIHGVEAYFNPSIDDWKVQYELSKLDKKKKKSDEEDVESGLVLEDESETKSRSRKDIVNERSHLVLLAQNSIGLKNLFKLISTSFQPGNFYRYPRIDFEMLKKHNEGLICLSACLGGALLKHTGFWEEDADLEKVFKKQIEISSRFKQIFGDRYFLELQWNGIEEQHVYNTQLIELSKIQDIKLVSTTDCHYPSPDKWKDREMYKCLSRMNKGGTLEDFTSLPDNINEQKYQIYPKNFEQVLESYETYSDNCDYLYDRDLVIESIENSHKIAHEMIEQVEYDCSPKLPSFVVPEGKDENAYLEQLAFEGLKKRGKDSEEYRSRLEEELSVIKDRKFAKYFLTMKSLSDEVQQHQLVGAGRGSAAGSLLSYSLEITHLDPIRWGLQFSRFLRKNAKDYPDIDYDCSEPMEIKEHFIEKWGKDCVAPITNWNTLQLKSLIKDIAKFYDIPFQEVNDITQKMFEEATPEAKTVNEITAGVYVPTYDECLAYSPSFAAFIRKYPQVGKYVNSLQGQIKSMSRHAGGILVSENLPDNMPLIASGGVIQTPWAEGQHLRHLEPLGFIKFDILGLASLRMMEGCIKRILQKQGNPEPSFEEIQQWYNDNISENTIDFNDQKVYKEIFHAGKFIGTFQFTEKGAQEFCQNARPTSLTDVSNITSIFRPGPLSANVDKKYIEAKEHQDRIIYKHPLIEECLGETYGFLIYQEQIALLAHKLGKDLSLDDGNALRKLLTKKGVVGKGSELDIIQTKFFEGAIEKGMSNKDIQELWDNIVFFNAYGFNKSHAISYSLLSYQCAYLLTYYPEEWIAAFLDKETEKDEDKIAAINLIKGYGYDVAPPDINVSEGYNWAVKDGKVFTPLVAIKGLGEAGIEQILANRPFEKIEDIIFNENVSKSKLNKRCLDAMARCGALKSLVDDRFNGEKHFWATFGVDRPQTLKKFNEYIIAYAELKDFSKEEKIENLTTLLGLYPLELVLSPRTIKKLSGGAIPSLGEISAIPEEYEGPAWFIPTKYEDNYTKNAKMYYRAECIDSSGRVLTMKIWNVNSETVIYTHRAYLAMVKKDSWGISSKNPESDWKLIS